ncbi:MAG TPA: VOC family protein [Pyrinomonadaceae bacterium]|jgi:catechol 2,3-dioxygenase-like lactoylglutathione lyase family enzyme
MLTGLDLLFLEVDNLAESVEFYELTLGFEVERLTPEAEPPMATLRGGRLRLVLAEQAGAMGRRGRGVHFFVGVADVDAFYARLRARGLTVAPPGDEGWGGRFVTLEDPDRYRFFFVTWHAAAGGTGLRGHNDDTP